MRHSYVSTACVHGYHPRCDMRCRWCDIPCLCHCHGEGHEPDATQPLDTLEHP
jgi:hypothetical protein